MTEENKHENSADDEIQDILESNVENLKSSINELETAVEHFGTKTEHSHERLQREYTHIPSSTELADFELSEVLATSGQKRLVIANFETALTLLDSDRVHSRGELKLILTGPIAQQLSDRFPINSYFQKLEERDDIKIRQGSTNVHLPGVILLEERLFYPVSFGSVNTSLEISNSELQQQLCDEFDTVFSEAGKIDLTVPPWKELLAGLAEATSSETAREFETLVEAATPDDLDSLDEVSLALIAAARTGALQYDISKWGEEMNIGSKATFSRRKSTLENDGVITTEPIKVKVGRPRDRLLLADESQNDRSASTRLESQEREDTVAKERSEDDSRNVDTTGSDAEKLDDMVDEMLREILLDEDS